MDIRNFTFMFYGFLAAWLILVVYVLSLVSRERKITEQLKGLKGMLDYKARSRRAISEPRRSPCRAGALPSERPAVRCPSVRPSRRSIPYSARNGYGHQNLRIARYVMETSDALAEIDLSGYVRLLRKAGRS
jgi:CcmD family protein